MRKIIISLALILTTISLFAQYELPPRPGIVASMAPFYHGVASGDPLSDRVIIWTRITTDSISAPVQWQVATDTLFVNIVAHGTFTTDTSLDYTVKIDVTGLTANTWYYYRFMAYGKYSIIGRTRTIPVGNIDSLRFAVFSCSAFMAGYFNGYHDIAQRNDIDAILHLGDWYYEYQAGGTYYDGDTNRLAPLDHDSYTLSDYRLWQSQYRLEASTRDMLQQYPLISIWDDHETCDNSWYAGAANHNPATQGSWFVRKHAMKIAYFEWMPIREIAPGNDTIIHRSFKWGNLLSWIMLDTRYEARDSSLGSMISTTGAYLTDTNRRMIGNTQLAWLENQLSDKSTQWKLVGNQVMIAPFHFLGQIVNGDQWDGYPAEKLRVFNYIMKNNIKDIVFLSGDIHSSWANDLPHPDSTYNSSTGAGSVATEMIGSSITSPAEFLGTITAPPSIVELSNSHVKYCEFTMRGYLLLDINKKRVQGDYIHVSNIQTPTYTASDDAQYMNLDGNRFLSKGTGPLGPRPGNPPLVGPVNLYAGIAGANDNIIMLTCYPNPTTNVLTMQYYLTENAPITISLLDMSGRTISTVKTTKTLVGLNNSEFDLSGYAAGIYFINLKQGEKSYTKKIVKN